MKRVTVFCGSSKGKDEAFLENAYQLGETLARNHIQLVYGGTKIGLMGAVAEGVLNQHGEAIGVLPRFLQKKEIAHPGLKELHLVDTMHERKVKMHELSDAVIALPGGFGTMEELFEMLTWGQLGLHKKPIGILNINEFYDSLIQFIDNMVQQGFLNKNNKELLLYDQTINGLLEKMQTYQHPDVEKWMNEKINGSFLK